MASLPVPAQARALLAQPMVRQLTPVAGLIALALAAFLVWSLVAGPGQRPVLANLSDADKSAAASALDSAGIGYDIDNGSGALTVADGDYHRARMLLAAQGLPKAAPAAAEVLGDMPLGASHAVEGERLRGAREADLARTIEALDPVETAKVHLAVAEPSLFVRDTAQPTASVLLTLAAGRTLGEGQVQAIVNLVATSVSGLAPERVSVVDQAGRLLSRTGDPAEGEAARRLDMQNQVEARLREALARLLIPLAGPDGFTAEVHADLDFDEKQSTRESYPEESRALRQEQQRWTATTPNAPAVGIPGATSNTPPPPGTLGATPQVTQPGQPGTTPARTAEDVSRSFELGREISVNRTAVGNLKRVTIAVALDDSVKKRRGAELKEIEALVQAAVGFDPARGDRVTVSARPFVAREDVSPPFWQNPALIGYARQIGAVIAVAVFFFAFVRPWQKRRAAVLAERRTEAAQLIEAELKVEQPVTIEMIEATPSYAERVALVRDFVRANPQRAALVMRDLTEKARG